MRGRQRQDCRELPCERGAVFQRGLCDVCQTWVCGASVALRGTARGLPCESGALFLKGLFHVLRKGSSGESVALRGTARELSCESGAVLQYKQQPQPTTASHRQPAQRPILLRGFQPLELGHILSDHCLFFRPLSHERSGFEKVISNLQHLRGTGSSRTRVVLVFWGNRALVLGLVQEYLFAPFKDSC